MWNDLRTLLGRTWSAFRAELDRREPEDQVAEMLAAMRREATETRALLPRLREEVELAEVALERERRQLAECEHRGALAERIGDAETARIAADFARRHRMEVAVAEQRWTATRAELELRTGEAERMMGELRFADANRVVLVSRLRMERTKAEMGERLGGASGPWEDFSRAEEAVEREGAPASPATHPSADADVEARLRELKRRMGHA